ncbi:hypothetical protein Hypma_015266 [Hypsizygus marmoreus]|uniref:SAGA-associated factor 11 n=1 Tax=Hypsizygus marmoreus TaxID=39966 RepID=A0A369K851_HYPMA|nr:hypothetical protein Hypma_015266 [Hypsizygus marmoreus]
MGTEIGANCVLNRSSNTPSVLFVGMPKSERDETLALLTARIFSAMVNDLVMDATLQSHHEVARSRAVCRVCHTHCGLAHAPGPSATANVSTMTSRPGTPASVNDAKAASGSSGTGTNTPTSVKDGNLYLDCVNCSRQIASNRYAPHLSTCMGLSSARRGAARGTNKSKQPSDPGRSVSPESDAGNVSDDSSKLKGKAKSMTKRADEAEFNLKRKRPVSPQVSPAKNQKKQKTSGSPVSRLKADPPASKARNNTYHPPSLSQSKVPSKLRDSSTASFIGGSSTSDSSRASSPGVTLASSFLGQNPPTRRNGKGKPKAAATVPLPKRPSPPRPPPLHVTDYTIDVEGEETGSSTDTDSS